METSTQVLRRLLDERGIEHDDEFVKSSIPYCDGYEGTYWGGDSFCYVEPIRPKPNTIGSHPELTMHDCTPEQAIAATLGAGECEMEYGGDITPDTAKAMGVYFCSECGSPIYNDCMPYFCGYCGKAVKR